MSVPPVLFAIAAWFVGTALVVWLDSRAQATFAASFRAAGLVALAATGAIAWTSHDAGPAGAYVAFAAAILLWGWHEMGFLMGFVAGPRKLPCPADATGWRRFRLATATVIHHEVALAATIAGLAAIGRGAPNQTAMLAFLLLFVMRLSAKFNLYLGVPSLSDEVFPEHLAYLKSYFRRRACNLLFPFSLALALAICWWTWTAAERAPPGGGAATSAALLFALAALGAIEHLFLVLPLRDTALWTWARSGTISGATPVAIID